MPPWYLNISSGAYQMVIVLVSPAVRTLTMMIGVLISLQGFFRSANEAVMIGSPSSSSVTVVLSLLPPCFTISAA